MVAARRLEGAPNNRALWGAELSPSGAQVSEAPGVAELNALRVLDVARLPGNADLAAIEASAALLDPRTAADDLRLPPPPVRAASGDALFRNLSRSVDKFLASAGKPVAAPAEAVTAEGRMMSLLHGIRGLQNEIHSLRDRHKPA